MAAASRDAPEARVLVVDDEENIRRLLALTLKRLSAFNVTVDTAGTAESAKELLDDNAYHLLITDYRMPGRTGVDLLAYASQVYPDTARMLITAYAEMDIGIEAVNRGRVDGFVRKPWDGRKFIALVESLISTRAGAAPSAPALASGSSTPAPASPPAPAAAPAPAPTPPPSDDVPTDRAGIEAELRDVDKALRQLRVRLGLGGISAEGFQRANAQLTQRKATLEVTLMKMTSAR